METIQIVVEQIFDVPNVTDRGRTDRRCDSASEYGADG